VLARSRYKVDRSLEFIPGYKVGGGHWRSVAVQVVSEPEICQGARFLLRADARVRVQEPLRICLGCRSKSKKCDKQLTFIVRVSGSLFLYSPGEATSLTSTLVLSPCKIGHPFAIRIASSMFFARIIM